MDVLVQLDGNILLFIQEHLRMDWLTPIVIFITNLGNGGFFWIALFMVLLFGRKYRMTGFEGLIAIAIGFLITNVLLKSQVARIRPYDVIDTLEYIGKMPHDFSFPSGHTTCSIAAGLVLLWDMPKKYGIPAIILGILISLSRLYVGVHYPSDVLGGVVVGFIGAFISVKLVQRLEKIKFAG